jgi:hypothetical protein
LRSLFGWRKRRRDSSFFCLEIRSEAALSCCWSAEREEEDEAAGEGG